MQSAIKTATKANGKVLKKSSLSKNILDTKYAVRGEIVMRAGRLEERLKKKESLPFSRITYCNIGNPQELGQKPLTFFRQVISCVENPDLLNHTELFPSDVIKRAKNYLSAFPSSGAYSHSSGLSIIREEVANFIAQRDGHSTDSDYTNINNIFLTDGASPAVQLSLRMLLTNPTDGVMIPIPQYPLYSASVTLLGGKGVPYYLDESKGWTTSVEELKKGLKKARSDGINTKGLVIINPGNPTGAYLDEVEMQKIVEFCVEENLVLMADEVYQENVYRTDKHWKSFKKVATDMKADVELLSFHSTSKGFTGECGKRGGYVEMTGIDQEVKDEFYKMVSVNLCPNIIGQLMMGLMVNPPKKGDDSFPGYQKERDDIISSLSRRSRLVTEELNKLEGVTCNESEGALYAFPKITIPQKAQEEAKKQGKAPDLFYCLSLLENTGLVVVPGSGFGQVEGTFHFRTTFLPLEEHITDVLNLLKNFHNDFMKKYK